jgi:hypothetical protein
MVIRKSAHLNFFSFRFDVELLIDLYSPAELFSFFLSSVELSGNGEYNGAGRSGLPPSRLLERVTEFFAFFPDKIYTHIQDLQFVTLRL